MSRYPKIKLSELRRIGWRDWDPIGLSDGSEFGPEECADEYDQYLLHAVSLLASGATRTQAAAYLERIAAGHIGLDMSGSDGAKRTIDSIAAYLKELPDSPPISD